MAYKGRFGQFSEQGFHTFSLSDEYRRDELICKIEHAVESLTLQELEAL